MLDRKYPRSRDTKAAFWKREVELIVCDSCEESKCDWLGTDLNTKFDTLPWKAVKYCDLKRRTMYREKFFLGCGRGGLLIPSIELDFPFGSNLGSEINNYTW